VGVTGTELVPQLVLLLESGDGLLGDLKGLVWEGRVCPTRNECQGARGGQPSGVDSSLDLRLQGYPRRVRATVRESTSG
jgi:hypothetical protein